MGDGEGAEGAGALGVDDALGDALAVEVSHFFDEPVVLHEDRPARAGGEGVLVVGDGRAGRGRELRGGRGRGWTGREGKNHW